MVSPDRGQGLLTGLWAFRGRGGFVDPGHISRAGRALLACTSLSPCRAPAAGHFHGVADETGACRGTILLFMLGVWGASVLLPFPGRLLLFEP